MMRMIVLARLLAFSIQVKNEFDCRSFQTIFCFVVYRINVYKLWPRNDYGKNFCREMEVN